LVGASACSAQTIARLQLSVIYMLSSPLNPKQELAAAEEANAAAAADIAVREATATVREDQASAREAAVEGREAAAAAAAQTIEERWQVISCPPACQPTFRACFPACLPACLPHCWLAGSLNPT
jgi:hypothetical protein